MDTVPYLVPYIHFQFRLQCSKFFLKYGPGTQASEYLLLYSQARDTSYTIHRTDGREGEGGPPTDQNRSVRADGMVAKLTRTDKYPRLLRPSSATW